MMIYFKFVSFNKSQKDYSEVFSVSPVSLPHDNVLKCYRTGLLINKVKWIIQCITLINIEDLLQI